MGGDQFDKRWYILGGFAVLAIVIVGIIVVSRSGSDSSTTTAKGGCKEVAEPESREDRLPKPGQTVKKGEKLTAVVETNCGTFAIALDTTQSPVVSNSFAYLAEKGFYDDTMFHRIVPEEIFQGGDPTGTGYGKSPGYTVVEAPPAGTRYTKGVVGMAKTSTDPSGSSSGQFFVVTAPEASFAPEYAVVGHVTRGMKVAERIGKLGNEEEKPTETVVIEKMTIERG